MKNKEKIFTEEEKTLVRSLNKLNYIARDEDGTLFGYTDKPEKGESCWWPNGSLDDLKLDAFTSLKFSTIEWQDEEPTSREEILNG